MSSDGLSTRQRTVTLAEESFASLAAEVPVSDSDAYRSATGPHKHDVTVRTSEPPSAVDEALEATGDLLGS